MKELWKDIKDYEGLYQISNLGRVKSLDRTLKSHFNNTNKIVKKGKLLKPMKQNNGYLSITLSKNNKTKMNSVHRLVASAFLPNSDIKKQVNHKDGIKDNNNINNLEWVTHSENQLHRFRVLGQEEASKIAIECISLKLKANSLIEMNDLLFERNISSKTSYSVLAKYYREKGKYFSYKGLDFYVIG